jgi:hypothetical protein
MRDFYDLLLSPRCRGRQDSARDGQQRLLSFNALSSKALLVLVLRKDEGAKLAMPIKRALRRSVLSGMAAGLALSLGGCGGGALTMTGGATFTPTMSYARSAKTPAQIVILFAGDQPARRFVRVGSLTARRSGYVSQEFLFNAIRDTGAENGLDGFMDVQCGSPGGVGAECRGTGFIYQ